MDFSADDLFGEILSEATKRTGKVAQVKKEGYAIEITDVDSRNFRIHGNQQNVSQSCVTNGQGLEILSNRSSL